MDIIVHAVCFNEAKLLPFFLGHYSKLSKKIYIYDNYSTDNSREIALSYKNVEVIMFDTGGILSEITLMGIRNNCWKGDASDLSIVCDMDEFLWAPNLITLLEEYKEYDVFKPVGFDMVSTEFPLDYRYDLTDLVRNGRYAPSHSKMIIFNPKNIADMNFGPGSHYATPVRKRGSSNVKIYTASDSSDDLKLLHYKNLGFKYRFNRHSELSTRLRGEEYEKYKFGIHYAYDLEAQEKEFLDLLMNSKKVIG
jgi:hypothetical protein